MQADEMVDEKSFERWLNARSRLTLGREAALLSLRTALRVMPLVVGGSAIKLKTGVLPELTYFALRCTALARTISHADSGTNNKLRNAVVAATNYDADLDKDIAEYAADSAEHAAACVVSVDASTASTASAASVDSAAHSAAYYSEFFADNEDSSAAIWAAIRADAATIESSGNRVLVYTPLWPASAPRPEGFADPELLRAEFRAATNGHVWLRWYDRMLSGARVSDEEEMLYAHDELLPLWEKEDGYLEVSAWLAERLAALDARAAISSTLPEQGVGTQMSATPEGRIGHSSADELDNEGNNLKRINQLRPLALQCAQDLKSRLANNQFPELISATDQYLVALTGIDNLVDWGTVWGLGIILESNAKAAAREITDRLLPELEDPAKASLDSLLKLHAPLVLSTKDGNDLFEEEKKYRLPAEELAKMYHDIEELVQRLRDAPDILRKDAKVTFELMASAKLDGAKPERTATYVASTTKNTLIVLTAGAVAASPTAIAALVYGPAGAVVAAVGTLGPGLLVQEAIKKSKPFAAIQATLTNGIDHLQNVSLRDWSKTQAVRFAPFKRFVIDNEAALLTVAESEKLDWLKDYIALIVRHNKLDDGGS